MNQVYKYKAKIDMKKSNSHTLIIKYIENNSKVLDVGCACGDIGIYLYNYKDCEVVGLDNDDTSIDVAKLSNSYHDLIKIDLNGIGDELDKYEKYFDYIIFGDVLEHLYAPEKVLEIFKKYLKDSGYYIISLPNIAHGSIKINIIKNKFNYTNTGLIDSTHIRFFTKENIIKLLDITNLKLCDMNYVIADIEGTAENAKRKDLPKKIVKYLEDDDESYIYQYVIKAQPNLIVNCDINKEKYKINKVKKKNKDKIIKNIKHIDEKYFNSILKKIYNITFKQTIANLINKKQPEDLIQYIEHIIETPTKTSIDYEQACQLENTSSFPVRLIAFYLPQFHPIKENDLWWGKGFTEWTNVTKSVPLYSGHYQPRLPGELGFYDLRMQNIQNKQAELAKRFGLHGFCFHYYWFSGKRLLEKPIFQYLENREIDFPFCLCWANENWTRRWDASENMVLMPQVHQQEDDLGFIVDIAPFFRDPRYIRVNGKILFIVYRIQLFDKNKVLNMVTTWREYCSKNGIGELYLVCAHTHGFTDNPIEWGFDAAIEFPPHNLNLPIINNKIKIMNSNYKGYIFDFKEHIKQKSYLEEKPYTLIKTVFPEWDNIPRMPNHGRIYYGAGKETYREWLTDCINYTINNYKDDERMVFINAWNEWAEGAYLEPDRKNGYSYLNITLQSLSKIDIK